mgnify:CR=1 FL=1|tara:strand:- start:2699 stop:3265 length:567 start_codon:yes stop_codon:yes gene_type:complete
MAFDQYIKLEGLTELMKTFDDIPKQIKRAGITGAARKASKPLIQASRKRLADLTKKSTGFVDEGLDDLEFSKAKFAARFIKSIAKKPSSFAPGVRVIGKGPDIPMNGGKKFINIQGYLKLMAAGSYKSGKRHHKSGKNTGQVDGHGNFIRDAYGDVHNQVDSIFAKNLFNEIEKAQTRAAKRHAKKFR